MSTVFNQAHCQLVQDATNLKATKLHELYAHLISQVLDINFASDDTHLCPWIADMAKHIRHAVIPLLTEDECACTVGPLVTEALDDIHTQVKHECQDYYTHLMAVAKAEYESVQADKSDR